MTQLLNKLNNYKYDNETVQNMINYLSNNVLPFQPVNNSDKSKIKRFKDKCNNFIVENNKLYYRNDGLNLRVVPNDEVNETLEQCYADPMYAGIGLTKFYDKISNRFLGIKQKDIKSFLPDQAEYQMTQPAHHIINKPIITTYMNERWAIDLVDMNRYIKDNRNYRYILSCIDYFTKKCWLRGLKNKTAQDVTNAMQSIINEANITPKIIQKDNGGEFQGDLNVWMKDNNIKYINTLSYTPQSNGLVENLNKNIRKIIRELFLRNNNHNWIDHLQDVANNKNTQTNRTTKEEPNDIWSNTYDNNDDVEEKIKKRAEQMLYNTQELNVGDYVRVKMSSLQSQIRKMIKDNMKKHIIVSWSPDIYVIDKVLKADKDNTVENNRYCLRQLNGDILKTQLKLNNTHKERRAKRFFASELLKVMKTEEPDTKYTFKKINKLNVVNDNEPIIKKKKAVKKAIVHKVTYDEPIVARPQRIRKAPAYLNDYELS